ncbi:MAG: molybdopterin-synthase adenylyltransferase MoeB [Sumerlaeia bacterium]
MKDFTPEQLDRYARHIVLPKVGGKGQKKLLDSRVFVIGAGGLGSPILLYLAAAGVGTLEIADMDRVDRSNLQRQIIHRSSTIGESKIESARAAIADLNPDVKVVAHERRVTARNAMELLANADVIVEGSDNFPTRYAVADAAFLLRKPLVSGAMFRFEGQVTVFPNDGGEDSPCYRCLFPEPPPAGAVASCQEAGIFGAVPGVIGSIQATETIKVLLGIGEPLIGRLLLFDALAMSFRSVKVRRNPKCALNGDRPTITQPQEMELTGEGEGCRA